MSEMKVKLAPFTTPNFVIQQLDPAPRQEGFREGPKWPLNAIAAEVLSELCDEFRADIFAKAGKTDPKA